MELKKYKLGEIADFNKENIGSTDKFTVIEYLDTSSITENVISGISFLNISDAPSRAQRKVTNNTIIYSTVRPRLKHYGILFSPKNNLIVSTGFVTIDVKDIFKDKIDARYLFLLLTQANITEYIGNIADTAVSAYPSINPTDISSIYFNFPDIQIQKIISDIWFNYDSKIELNRAINQNLEAMAKQLYDYWFVQFDFPDENGRPYKSSGGKMVWNEKLKREIPENWHSDNICLIADILSGGTPSKQINEYWNCGHIPFFGPTDYNGSMFQLQTADKITESGLQHCSSSLFEENTIIITARGSIGKLVIVGTPMAMNQSCYALKSKNEEYEYLYFLTIQLIESLKAKGSGSVFKSIIASDIENTMLCVANKGIISLFCDKVSPIMKQIKKNTQEMIHLTKQRDELLPLLMNGQVSVNSDLSDD
ncbi:restriction endonuclease subunit S [Bacteroides fragilis]|nr:restriction endonuclease subunit S [Bacteroides fragilis]